MRVGIALPILFVGAIAGVIGCLLFWYLWEQGVVPGSKYFLAIVFGVPFAAAGFSARAICRLIVRRRGRTWAGEVARRYGVSKTELEDIVQYWD